MQQETPYKVCPSCSQQTLINATSCPRCNHQFSTQFAQPPMPTQAFYGIRPQYLQDASSKKLASGICGIVIGALGIHKFLLGYQTAGLIMLLGSILTCGIAAPVFSIIGLIEGIMYLTKSDEEFHARYIANRQEWF